MRNWRDYLFTTVFLVLLGAAGAATVGDGPLPNMKGAWVTRALR